MRAAISAESSAYARRSASSSSVAAVTGSPAAATDSARMSISSGRAHRAI